MQAEETQLTKVGLICLFVSLSSLPTYASKSKKKAEVPLIQSQLAETAFLLRSSQNSAHLVGNETTQLMNLCRVIGQTQVLLLQIDTKKLPKQNQGFVQSHLEASISELNQACDGSMVSMAPLKRAWQLTGKVQKRLTKLSKSLLPGAST